MGRERTRTDRLALARGSLDVGGADAEEKEGTMRWEGDGTAGEEKVRAE